MGSVFFEQSGNTPRFGCTDCMACQSVIGTSLNAVQMRGCCMYFPEFSLVDIRNMVTAEGGSEVLSRILAHPGSEIHPFRIRVKGSFDEAGHAAYRQDEPLPGSEEIRDDTVFFRTCPFVVSGVGCSIPLAFRTVVCNFFVCRELWDRAEDPSLAETYRRELERYSSWLHRECLSFQHLFEEYGVDLLHNRDTALRLLREADYHGYGFPPLPPLTLKDRRQP